MKKYYSLLLLLLCSLGAAAQTTLLDLEGTPPVFEDFNGSTTVFIANPDAQAPNASATVAENTIPPNQEFAGVKVTQAIDLSEGKTFSLQVWSPIANAPILLKFESGEGAPTTERAVNASGPANSWQELTFDFSSDPSSSYLFVVIFMNFNVNTSADSLTFYWDNLIQSGDGGGGDGMGDGEQMDLPVTFDNPEVDYGLDDFGGNVSMFTVNPEDNTDTVAASTKTAGSATFAGTTLNSTTGGPMGFASRIPFSAEETTITVDVWSPTAGTPVRLKVEKDDDPTISVETQTNTTVANAWETLTFDFASEATGTAALNLNSFYNKLSIFFDFGSEPTVDTTYLWDNVLFNGEGGIGGGDDDVPMVAAPTPTRDAANVISMFSNAYTNVPVDTWRTEWTEGTVLTDIQIEGNDTKRYDNLGFVGIETVGSPIDLETTEMTHMHINYWAANLDSIRIKLVDFLGDGFDGGNGDTEDELTFATQKLSWGTLEIPLDDFMAMSSQADINQMLFVGVPGGSTVYIDNVYFYKQNPDATTTPLTGVLQVWPNPTQSRVNITAPVRMDDLKLYGSNGSLVGKYRVNAERFDLDVSHLAPGLYVALVSTPDGPLTVKIFKD